MSRLPGSRVIQIRSEVMRRIGGDCPGGAIGFRAIDPVEIVTNSSASNLTELSPNLHKYLFSSSSSTSNLTEGTEVIAGSMTA